MAALDSTEKSAVQSKQRAARTGHVPALIFRFTAADLQIEQTDILRNFDGVLWKMTKLAGRAKTTDAFVLEVP